MAVGKTNAQSVAAHASSHASNGTDPITPASIGAASILKFTNVSVATNAWASDSTYTDFGYRASIALTGVTANMMPDVVFDVEDTMEGNFAPVATSYAGGIYIYAAEIPDSSITIKTIVVLG